MDLLLVNTKNDKTSSIKSKPVGDINCIKGILTLRGIVFVYIKRR